jgi:hypothetical protein
VSDAEVRALLREARAGDDAGAWLRASQALVRLGRWDEAGLALLHARARGAKTDAVEDQLAPPSVLGFSQRAVGAALEYGRLGTVAWAPDGRTLYSVGDLGTVLAFGLEPASPRRVIEVAGTGEVTSVASDLEGRVLVCEAGPEGGGVLVVENGVPVARHEIAGERADYLAGWGERGHVFAAVDTMFGVPNTGHVVWWTPGMQSYKCEPATLCDDGSFAVWRPPAVELHAPRASEPHARVPLGNDPLWRLNGDVTPRFPTLRAARRFAEAAPRLEEVVRTRRLQTYSVVAAPSGRHVAVLPTDASVELLDLETKESRTFRIDGPPLGAAWSPSGRRLAVVTKYRIALLEYPEDPLVALEEEYQALEARGGVAELWRRLERDLRPEAGEWLLRRLELGTVSAETDGRVVAAANALARRRVAVDVARVRSARRALPRRKALETAMGWLLHVQDGLARGLACNCELPFRTPAQHGDLVREGQGNFTREGGELAWWRCRTCGRRHELASPPPPPPPGARPRGRRRS